jgi:Acetoacetate decarboxylase (ADC)
MTQAPQIEAVADGVVLPERYRMPTVFGPTAGPRQGPLGQRFDYSQARRETATVSFLTDSGKLGRYLPPRCALEGEPIVTLERTTLFDLEWLAGRSYSLLNVKFTVRYRGGEEAVGPFLSVLWENMVEPILSGREELGYAKLFCELPPPRTIGANRCYRAVWDGHEFFRLSLYDLHDEPASQRPAVSGVLHHRYLPAIAREGGAAVDEMVLTPAGGMAQRIVSRQAGRGEIMFVRSSWEQMPTMFHIVNALADLPILEYRECSLVSTIGFKDLSDQRVLR